MNLLGYAIGAPVARPAVLGMAAALILGTAAVAATAAEPVRVVDDSARRYAETWTWCEGRFPYREDLQEACKWGAYEMLPAQETLPSQETRDA